MEKKEPIIIDFEGLDCSFKETNSKKLADYLEVDEDMQEYLFIPDIYFIRDGKVVSHSKDMIVNSTEESDSLDDEDDKIKNKYIKLLKEYYEENTNA